VKATAKIYMERVETRGQRKGWVNMSKLSFQWEDDRKKGQKGI